MRSSGGSGSISAAIAGKKTNREKFAGALATYAIEALMTDGRALQMGTSHHLGQHFSRVFNIRFEDRNQNLQYVWQTSWGVSTRLVGAVVMCHGDDSGLKLPPRIAPIQVIIVPISVGNWKESVLPSAREIEKRLTAAGVRVKLDAREEYTPGWKFAEYEMRGVPLRLEVGPREVKSGKVVLVRRDTGEKETIDLNNLEEIIPKVLDDIQKNLFDLALRFQQANTHDLTDYQEFKRIIEEKRGFIRSWWCGEEACEELIKEETAATIRVIPLEPVGEKRGVCLRCRKEAPFYVYFARAY